MKKQNYFISLLFCVVLALSVSCGKGGGNTPVDQYVEVLDQAREKTEKINSTADLLNFQDIVNPQDAWNIIKDNSEYVLTDSDKDKLKKSYDKLLKVAYEKTIEYGGLPDEMKDATKAQVDLIIDAANKGIDNAKTLGDLNAIR
ncbi:MAG: hypothetical protein J1F12_02635 [Muribaculaceae bacterium]|nr:hypothetical protein [Muribaculaceae bacterium]